MPRVSVILPAYRSQRTVAGCLEALRRQTYQDFEVVLVDSSPDDETARLVSGDFPEVIFEHSSRRLLPHAARNRGVELARGDLLVFSDPDIYAPPEWLGELVASHDATGAVVVGALECHGERWLDRGIHLCKFSKWLPGGPAREVDMGPTANLLVHRETFQRIAGFDGDHLLSDVTFSWQARRMACLRFEPRAVVEHHHVSGPAAFLHERWSRGRLFGELRTRWHDHGRLRSLLFLGVSVFPVRLARIAVLTARHARRADGWGPSLWTTLPIWLAGHLASLLGESRAYLTRALRPHPSALPRPAVAGEEHGPTA